MGSFSIWHWLIVLAIVLLIFGTKKLRNIGGDLGGAVKNFKDAVKKEEDAPQQIPQQVKDSAGTGQTIDVEAKDKTKGA
mgnify:CR=1 FL=1